MKYKKEYFYLHVIFILYALGIFLKKIFHFQDGIIDIVIILTILMFLILNLSKTIQGVKKLLQKKVFLLFLLFAVYFIILSFFSYNDFYLIILEFFSVLKWIIYFFLGYLYAYVYLKNDTTFPLKLDILLLSTIVLLFSLATYNWSGIGGVTTLFGFYYNSFESLFSIRSVFATFGFLVFLYALETFQKNRLLGVYLLFSSLIFIFMSGNRKILIAVAIVFLFMKIYNKYKIIIKFLKILIFILGLFFIVQSTIFKKSTQEYSNLNQPRIFSYIKSFQIAYDYFPVGSGPATAFSKGSMVNYSPIYYKYNIDKKWGFGPDDKIKFYNDTYWSQIIAQYGFIGVILILTIYIYIINMTKNIKEKRKISFSLILIIFLLLSISTPILQRIEVSLFIFFLIGMKLGQHDKRKLNEER